jgi:hypothetical protein
MSDLPHATLQRKSHFVFIFWELRGLSSNFNNHVSVSDLYIPKIGPHISCSRIGRSIIGIYKSLTDINTPCCRADSLATTCCREQTHFLQHVAEQTHFLQHVAEQLHLLQHVAEQIHLLQHVAESSMLQSRLTFYSTLQSRLTYYSMLRSRPTCCKTKHTNYGNNTSQAQSHVHCCALPTRYRRELCRESVEKPTSLHT